MYISLQEGVLSKKLRSLLCLYILQIVVRFYMKSSIFFQLFWVLA